MKPFVALLAVVAVVAFVSCRGRNDQPAGTFITTPGSYEFFGAKMTVTVTAQTNGAVNYRIGHGSSVSGPPRPTLRLGQPWFIYPESETKAWVYDGRTNVSMVEFKQAGTKVTTTQRAPELWAAVPQAVKERVPAEAREGR